MALLYAVVCLMMLPYPKLVEQAGGDFSQVLEMTGALVLFTAVAGFATWLLEKRHAFWWLGQVALAAGLLVLAVLSWGQF